MLSSATDLVVIAQTRAMTLTDQRLMMNTITSDNLRGTTEAALLRTMVDIPSQRNILRTSTNLATPLPVEERPVRAGPTMAIVLRLRMTTWATDMTKSLLAVEACGMMRRRTGPRSCGEEGASFSKLSKLIPWGNVTEFEIVSSRACGAYKRSTY
jgi:hypothetical protein